MTEKVPNRTRVGIPESASATSIILLALATIACGVGAVVWWHAPLALCTLVVGAYVLHLLAVRRAARDAIAAESHEFERLTRLREEEYQRQLAEVALMEPELAKERARLEQQWQHLKGLVDEREGRRKTLAEYEKNLEAVRHEAASALEKARHEARNRENSEQELRDRIAELEEDRKKAVTALRKVVAGRGLKKPTATDESETVRKAARADRVLKSAEQAARVVVADAEETARALVAEAETKLESARVEEQEREQTRKALATQIEELEQARTEAESALLEVAARRRELQEDTPQPPAYAAVATAGAIRGDEMSSSPASRSFAPDPPRLRAWQFIAHKRDLARRGN